MSQNIRADGASSMPHGSSSKLFGVGPGEHVALLHAAEAVDRRAVELHALVEGVLELGRRDGEGLELAEHVGEPEPDEPDPAFLDGAQHVVLLAFHHPTMLTWPARRLPALVRRFTWRSHSGNGGETGRWEPGSADNHRSLSKDGRDLQGRVHLDRRHRADRQAALEDQDPPADGAELPIWGFDGSSTNQAPGSNSDCVLQPVFACPDPIRGGDNMLVMCEVLLTDMTPHPTNTRALLRPVAEKYAAQEPLFGIEQEYTFFKKAHPLGFPAGGFPAPQGGYYCGVGADEVYGRDVVEAHLDNCLAAGLAHLRHQRRGHARPVGVPGRPARRRSRSPTSCGSPAGCCTARPRTSASRRRSTRSR